MILVKSFFAYNDLRNFSYLVANSATGDAWVIDPFEAQDLSQYIKKNGFTLRGILNTHQHWDHIQGNAPLSNEFNAPVKNLQSGEDIKLDENFSLETLATPGHTLDHKAFLWKKNNDIVALFSGDTLFNAGVGNCRGGGDVNLLFDTTKMLRNLPASTLLYPGHDYRKRNMEFALSVEQENKDIKEELKRIRDLKTEELPPVTLEEELKVNPFFRLNSDEIKQSLSGASENERELFINLRKRRDQW